MSDTDIHPAWRRLLAPHEPFAAMPADMLSRLLGALTERKVRRAERILGPEDGVATELLIILDGVVKAEDARSGETFSTLVAGEMFPLGALAAERPVTNRYLAEDDCRIAVLDAATFRQLQQDCSVLRDFCTRRLANLLTRARQLAGHDQAGQAGLRSPVSALLGRPIPCCPPEATLRQTLQTMHAAGSEAVVITSHDTRPIGLFTLRDLLRITLADISDEEPVERHMQRDPPRIAPDTLAASAMLVFTEHDASHLLVCQGDRLLGLLTEHDLTRLSQLDLKELLLRIDTAENQAMLVDIAQHIRTLTLALLRQGMEADAVTRLTATLYDRLTARLCSLHFADITDADIAWLALGSEGRLEQTFRTEQDNALVFRPHDPARLTPLRQELMHRAQKINEALALCGLPLCRNGVMAGTPAHCLTLDEWHATFARWVDTPAHGTLKAVTLYFDLRPVWGSPELGDALAGSALHDVHRNPRCLKVMADNLLARRPPLGFMGRVIADKGRLDLKLDVADFFVEGARLLALAAASKATRTTARLHEAGRLLDMDPADLSAWHDSFSFIQDLRLKHQVAQQEQGLPADNLIDPETLGPLDHRILKETLRQARKLQQQLAARLLD